MCDLAFTFSYCWIFLFALNICDGSYDLDFWTILEVGNCGRLGRWTKGTVMFYLLLLQCLGRGGEFLF